MASETPDHNAGESEPHASNTPGSDLAILVKAATDEMRTFREQRERGDRGTNVREWLTVALLVSTTIGVFWQVREMIKVYAPIQDQAAAAQQSAAAAKQSADAARESADLARNNAEIQLRPYVVIEGSGIRMTSNALEADLTAKNVGLTPAYKSSTFRSAPARSQAGSAIMSRAARVFTSRTTTPIRSAPAASFGSPEPPALLIRATWPR